MCICIYVTNERSDENVGLLWDTTVEGVEA